MDNQSFYNASPLDNDLSFPRHLWQQPSFQPSSFAPPPGSSLNAFPTLSAFSAPSPHSLSARQNQSQSTPAHQSNRLRSVQPRQRPTHHGESSRGRVSKSPSQNPQRRHPSSFHQSLLDPPLPDNAELGTPTPSSFAQPRHIDSNEPLSPPFARQAPPRTHPSQTLPASLLQFAASPRINPQVVRGTRPPSTYPTPTTSSSIPYTEWYEEHPDLDPANDPRYDHGRSRR